MSEDQEEIEGAPKPPAPLPRGAIRLMCEGISTHNCRVEVADGEGGWLKLRGVTDVRMHLSGSERERGGDQSSGLNVLNLSVYADAIHVEGIAGTVALQTLIDGAQLVVSPKAGRPGPQHPGDAK